MFAPKYPKGTSVNFWAFTGKYAEAYWFSGVENGFANFLSAFQRTFFRISLKFISRRRG
jgi:hypothetical protein